MLYRINETDRNKNELLDLVIETLNTSGLKIFDKWELSEILRLGKKDNKNRRPTLVKLTLAWKRTEILNNNKALLSNIYATEKRKKSCKLEKS